MYAWNTGSFDNEHATDWLDDLIESADLSSIVLALQTAVEFGGTEDLEAVDCACAVAAAEVVAAAAGNPSGELPKKVTEFVEAQGIAVAPKVLALARKSLSTIKRSSSLRSYWKGEGSLSEWLDSLDELEGRLKANAE
jgi:hypothetical protein